MLKLTVYNQQGEKVRELELNPKIFDLKINPKLVQQAVAAQQANARPVLAHAKDRSEVAGGGRKPWRQKGTGRARHGSIRSPLWRGGGVTFGPTKNRNWSLKINRKAKQKAILMVLTDKANNEKIILLDQLNLDQAKTKKFFAILQQLNLRPSADKKTKNQTDKKNEPKQKKVKDSGAGKSVAGKKVKSVLLVMPKKDQTVQRAARNIERLNIIAANSLNVVDLLKHQYLLMPVTAIEQIEKTFSQ